MRARCAFRVVAVSVLIFACATVVAQSNPIPFLNQALAPVSAKPGSPAFTLTVSGTGFAPLAVVSWNGSGRLTEVISSSLLKATISAADVAHAGTASITVTNPAPGGGTSNVVFFPVRAPLAAVAMASRLAFVGGASTGNGVVTGDFNNDGKLDVVTSVGELTTFLGKGNGSFAAPISTVVNFPPVQMVTGDFNGDGKLDVAGMNCCPEAVVVFLGDGAGGFSPAGVIPGGFRDDLVAAADFNGDGKLDLYVTGWNNTSQWFAIDLGVGNGTLNPGGSNDLSYFPSLPAIGDFNGDGILDLAIPMREAGPGIDIFLGNGDGTFRELGVHNGGSTLYVAAADMNHDGKLDLITDKGCILLGKGDGTFTESGCGVYKFTDYALPVIGDFNGDGNLDVALISQGVILLGAGDGTFLGTSMFSPGSEPVGPFGAVGDFNHDGMLDLVTEGGFLVLQTTAGVSPDVLSFGNQNVGTKSGAQTATLTNVGSSPLIVNGITIGGPGAAYFIQTNDCGTSVAVGSKCTIDVTFAPKAGGVFTPELSVSYKGVASPQKVGLSGTGLTPPKVMLSPSSLKFATQQVGTTSVAQTANLMNTGMQDLTISGISATAPFSQANSCGSGVGGGGSCQIQVTFKPTAAGTVVGTLTVSDNAVGTPQKVTLTGSGTVITFSPVGVNFGSQKVGTKSGVAPITLTNNGANAVSITQVSVAGANAADFAQTNNCGKSVAGHGSCTINVTFKPTATGARSGAVSVTDNGGGSPQSVPLAGTGT